VTRDDAFLLLELVLLGAGFFSFMARFYQPPIRNPPRQDQHLPPSDQPGVIV
jgi:hypothetical protein